MLYFLKKLKKASDIIILHLCTRNLDDMIYSSWDIDYKELKLVVLGHLLPFYPPKKLKNQNFEKMKKNC